LVNNLPPHSSLLALHSSQPRKHLRSYQFTPADPDCVTRFFRPHVVALLPDLGQNTFRKLHPSCSNCEPLDLETSIIQSSVDRNHIFETKPSIHIQRSRVYHHTGEPGKSPQQLHPKAYEQGGSKARQSRLATAFFWVPQQRKVDLCSVSISYQDLERSSLFGWITIWYVLVIIPQCCYFIYACPSYNNC